MVVSRTLHFSVSPLNYRKHLSETVSLNCPGCTETHYIVQVGLKHTAISLPQHPECWNDKCGAQCPAQTNILGMCMRTCAHIHLGAFMCTRVRAYGSQMLRIIAFYYSPPYLFLLNQIPRLSQSSKATLPEGLLSLPQSTGIQAAVNHICPEPSPHSRKTSFFQKRSYKKVKEGMSYYTLKVSYAEII